MSVADERDIRDIEEFVRKNYLDVYSYLYRRVLSVSDAQDLTQDTFLRYLSKVEKDEIDKKGRAYLFTIAKNICNDFYRKKLPAFVQITPEIEESLSAADSPGDGFDELITSLDEELQEVLTLKYALGFGTNEIAEITGFSRFVVRRKLARALAELGKQ